MSDQLYLLKPLEWTRPRDGLWLARSVFGLFRVDDEEGEGGFITWDYSFIPEFDDACPRKAESVEDAKRQAEEFYRSRILPALSVSRVGHQTSEGQQGD